MNSFSAAGLACVAALALWRGTKERWIFTLIGMVIIAATVKYATQSDDFGWLIFSAGYVVFMAGVAGVRRWDKCVAESRSFFSKAGSGKYTPPSHRPAPSTIPAPLWCNGSTAQGKDGHFIGPNEPYRFLYDDGTLTGAYLVKDDEKETNERSADYQTGYALINSWHNRKPNTTGESGLMCLDCVQKGRQESRARYEELVKIHPQEFEWNAMSETEREARCMVAKGMGWCPKCQEPLNSKSSTGADTPTCPTCHEFPDNPNAPMHKVKRVLEFASLSESEWRTREVEAITRREKNLSAWCTKGADGIWRRNDNGQEWTAQ